MTGLCPADSRRRRGCTCPCRTCQSCTCLDCTCLHKAVANLTNSLVGQAAGDPAGMQGCIQTGTQTSKNRFTLCNEDKGFLNLCSACFFDNLLVPFPACKQWIKQRESQKISRQLRNLLYTWPSRSARSGLALRMAIDGTRIPHLRHCMHVLGPIQVYMYM